MFSNLRFVCISPSRCLRRSGTSRTMSISAACSLSLPRRLDAANLRSFLVSSRSALSSADGAAIPALHIVVGNEACDADSIVSAILWAFYLHVTAGCAASSALIAAVVSCRRSDWPLRREAAYLLMAALGDEDDARYASAAQGAALKELADLLVFLDDGPTIEHVRRVRRDGGTVRATLTDHNALDAGGRALGLHDADVVEIVDHHADAGAHAHVVGNARRVDFDAVARRGVGSACTLVAAALLSTARPSEGRPALPPLDAPLAELLLGVILLDTGGLEAAAGRTTDEDRRVAAALIELCRRSEDSSPEKKAALDPT